MADTERWRATAIKIADETLFPSALAVDREEKSPQENLDLLAGEGFYGIAAPPELGGLGLGAYDVIADVVTAFAGGCLTTTFIGLQHFGPVLSVAASPFAAIRDTWLGPLCRGERRAGIALAGLRPGPAQVHVEAIPGGYLVSGETAWVTGWGMIDTLQVAARDENDVIHFLLLDAVESPTLTVGRTHLVAVQASNTVTVRFDRHFVPAGRLTHTQPFAQWAGEDAFGSSLNGFLALGVALRCADLIGPSPLDDELPQVRAKLLTAPPAGIPVARSQASLLAMRAATTLVVQSGSRSVLSDHHAQRLYREAGFLLVFGTRPAIKQQLLERLAAGQQLAS
jgi:alkylation response protein AidB-like acyl-CoA dehydrogenase